MSIFNRNRRGFDRAPDVQPDATGYQEKTVFQTDLGGDTFSQSDNGAQPARGDHDGAAQGVNADNYGAAPSGGYTYSPQPSGVSYSQAPSGAYGAVAAELPMVFASHEHKDIYIYDYSDRVEYYLRTQTKMVLIKTERKNKL